MASRLSVGKAAAGLAHFRLLLGVLSVGRRRVIFDCWPGVAELADAPDSKSGGRKAVWVRPPPPGPYTLKFCARICAVILNFARTASVSCIFVAGRVDRQLIGPVRG